jgi:hypothetical protein
MSASAILQAQEFQRAADQRSQTAVVARWGLPQAVVAGVEGQTRWLDTVHAHVRVRPGGIPVTSPSRVAPGGERCIQYLFRFDPRQV